MSSIVLIATNTLRQTIRQQLFYNVVLFGVGMVILAMVVGNLTFGFADQVVRSIGLSGVSLAVDLMALLIGVTLVHQEIDRKTLFVVLARPIPRWKYVSGRFFGLLAALILMIAGLSVVFAIVLSLVHGSITKGDLIALAMVVPEAAIIGAIGVALSAFTTPTLGTGMGVGAWIICASTDDLVRLTEGTGEAHQLAKAVNYALPSLARLNFRDAVVYNQAIHLGDVASATVYATVYVLALVALASAILSRREMV